MLICIMTLKTQPKTTLTFVLSRKDQAFLCRTPYRYHHDWLSFENLIFLKEFESHYANRILHVFTRDNFCKFVHGFSTVLALCPQKLVLLVDLVMIRGNSYFV